MGILEGKLHRVHSEFKGFSKHQSEPLKHKRAEPEPEQGDGFKPAHSMSSDLRPSETENIYLLVPQKGAWRFNRTGTGRNGVCGGLPFVVNLPQ